MFSIVDRYVLRQVAKPLMTAVTIGLLVMMAERMVRLLDDTLGKKNSFGLVFELLAYLVPHYLGLALPAAMFLGLLFGFNKMSKDSEVDAFMASGAGLHRLLRPVIWMSVLLAVASLFIYGWLQPYTRYAYRSVLFNVRNVEVFYLAEEGVFMQAGTRTFILDNLSRGDNKFKKIFLFDYKGAAGAETVTAEQGALINLPGEPRPVLRLEHGHRLKIEPWPRWSEKGPPVSPVSGSFQQIDTPLGRITKKVFRPRGEDQRELTLPEIVRALDKPRKGISPDLIRSELNRRLVFVATIPMLPFLALPFAIGRRRGQRAYRFGIALAILVAYHEIIEQGALATRLHGTSPLLTMWLPFAVIVVFSMWRFYNVSFVLKADRLEPWLDRMSDVVRGIKQRVFRNAEAGS